MNLIAIDLETTGLDPKKDRIIEIAAIKVKDGQIVDTFETFIQPGRSLVERVTQITGIRDEDLVKAPKIQDKLLELSVFLEDYPLLGHSLLFDFSFLKKAFVNEGHSFEKKGIDTLRIARCFLPEMEKKTLPYLCQQFEIPHEPHRAYADALACLQLYEKFITQFGNRDDGKLFEPIPLVYQAKKEGPITKAQKERLEKALTLHNIQPEYEISMLTKNEASRLLDEIYASYGRLISKADC